MKRGNGQGREKTAAGDVPGATGIKSGLVADALAEREKIIRGWNKVRWKTKGELERAWVCLCRSVLTLWVSRMK